MRLRGIIFLSLILYQFNIPFLQRGTGSHSIGEEKKGFFVGIFNGILSGKIVP